MAYKYRSQPRANVQNNCQKLNDLIAVLMFCIIELRDLIEKSPETTVSSESGLEAAGAAAASPTVTCLLAPNFLGLPDP